MILKNAIGVDSSEFARNTNFASLKSDIHILDMEELEYEVV